MSKEKKESLEKETKKTNKEKKVSKKEDTKVSKKEEKEKKKSIFSRILGYFKGVRKEISRIRWTKGKELLKYSVAAVSIIFVFCVYFYIIDILVALLRSSL